MTRELDFVSLFSGAGGLDIGFEAAGWKCLFASDHDPHSVETLRRNQGKDLGTHVALEGTVIYQGDVSELTGRSVLRSIDRRKGDVLALVGGPPCQSWSSAGHQLGLEDPRGGLFKDYVRIASELDVRWLVFENVRGLLTARGLDGKPGSALELIRRSLLEAGFHTEVDLLNAADYGVPQRRVRLFMIGFRRGDRPGFPYPTHSKSSSSGLLPFDGVNLEPWVSLRECLAKIASLSPDEIIRPNATLAAELLRLSPGTGVRSPGKAESTRPGGHWGYKQGAFVTDPNFPSRTITASSQQDWLREGKSSIRRLSPRECAAIQTFPAQWEFDGSRSDQYRLIGNAVPPLLARAIAESLASHVVAEPAEKRTVRPCELSALPLRLVKAIEYTAKEERANGVSRRSAPSRRRVRRS